jgi:putative transposase
LGRELETRQEAYRDLFRFELDEAAISDLRLALQQEQAVGSEKCKEAMSAASGVRRTQTWRGRSAKLVAESVVKEDQADFGF